MNDTPVKNVQRKCKGKGNANGLNYLIQLDTFIHTLKQLKSKRLYYHILARCMELQEMIYHQRECKLIKLLWKSI